MEWVKIRKQAIVDAIKNCEVMELEYKAQVDRNTSFSATMNAGMDLAATKGAKTVLVKMLQQMVPVE